MAVSYEGGTNGVGTITLDKPPANSYDLEFMQEFSDAVDEAIGSDSRVVLLRSASEKFFSAGADVKRFLEGDVDSNMEMIRTSQATFKRIAAAPQVFVAHIAGHALGGGLEIALGCDLRVATAGRYKLGTPEVSLGLLPGNGGTQRLTRMLGTSRALDLLLTGKTFTAEQALEWGLIAELFEDEAQVQAYVERFAIGPALALRNIKRSVYEGGQLSLSEGLELEGELVEELFSSQDGNEGLTAFAEKRTPTFTGA
jgi:enoyl-CoA hydratase/carnithine racemase